MKARPIVTVQPLRHWDADGRLQTRALLRLRGKWLAEIFPPHARVRVTREERNGRPVLVLESA